MQGHAYKLIPYLRASTYTSKHMIWATRVGLTWYAHYMSMHARRALRALGGVSSRPRGDRGALQLALHLALRLALRLVRPP